jgi:hypothetical protein
MVARVMNIRRTAETLHGLAREVNIGDTVRRGGAFHPPFGLSCRIRPSNFCQDYLAARRESPCRDSGQKKRKEKKGKPLVLLAVSLKKMSN